MCVEIDTQYEAGLSGDITTSSTETIGEIHLNIDDSISFFFEAKRITNGHISVSVVKCERKFSYIFCIVAVLQIKTFCNVKQQHTHIYANSSNMRMRKDNAEKKNKECRI